MHFPSNAQERIVRPPFNFSCAGAPHLMAAPWPASLYRDGTHRTLPAGVGHTLEPYSGGSQSPNSIPPNTIGKPPHGVPRPFHRFKQRHQPTRQNGMRPPAPPLRTGINNPRKPMMTSLWSEQRWATDSLVQLDGSRDDEPPSMLSRTPAPSPVGDSWSATRCRPRKT